jgi:flavin-dependent dehydrogenase
LSIDNAVLLEQNAAGMDLYDALVIGAGPMGSQVAYQLANQGYKVAVFEEHEEVGQPACCTGLVGKECVDKFGIPKACVVDRASFDVAWAQRAQTEGAEYFLFSRVTDIAILGDKVRIEIARDGGKAHFEGKTAVIAAGFNPKLTTRIGLGQVGDFIVGAQTEVDIKGVDEIEVYVSQQVAPGFFAWLVPLPRGKGLVGLLSRKKPQLYLKAFLDSLWRKGKIAISESYITYGVVPLRSLPKTYRERVLIVGDAAGQVKPTTGGGIYYGLLCADIAAETINRALGSGDFSSRLFSQYEKAWKAKLGRELRIGYFARRIYERLSDRQIDNLFHAIGANGIHEDLLQLPLSFDWHGEIILRVLRHPLTWPHLTRALFYGGHNAK